MLQPEESHEHALLQFAQQCIVNNYFENGPALQRIVQKFFITCFEYDDKKIETNNANLRHLANCFFLGVPLPKKLTTKFLNDSNANIEPFVLTGQYKILADNGTSSIMNKLSTDIQTPKSYLTSQYKIDESSVSYYNPSLYAKRPKTNSQVDVEGQQCIRCIGHVGEGGDVEYIYVPYTTIETDDIEDVFGFYKYIPHEKGNLAKEHSPETGLIVTTEYDASANAYFLAKACAQQLMHPVSLQDGNDPVYMTYDKNDVLLKGPYRAEASSPDVVDVSSSSLTSSTKLGSAFGMHDYMLTPSQFSQVVKAAYGKK